MTHAAYYARSENSDRYESLEATTGPWDPTLQHGGPVAALLGTRIERQQGDGQRVAHLSLDFLSGVPVAPLDVSTEVARPGKRIALWTAEARAGARVAARATAWALAVRDGRSPATGIDTAVPALPEKPTETFFPSMHRFPYGDSFEWRFAEGGFTELGPASVWCRMRVAIVDGEPVTPLGRVLAMVDSANGISAALDLASYLFVPVNLSVSVLRPAVGEWVGMRAETSISGDGAGVTRARLFDRSGTVGEAVQTLFVEPR
jgi:acyl-coenzyme A thioesterase PaaI-like protein